MQRSFILRPILAVIGFYLAIIVAQPVADFINATYANAVMGAESGSITGVTSLIAYVGIYVTMMTTVMHSVFALINWVPDNVLRWVGAGLQAHGVGDAETSEMKGSTMAAFRGGTHVATNAKPKAPSGNKNKNDKGGDDGGGGGGGGNKPSGGDFNEKDVRPPGS